MSWSLLGRLFGVPLVIVGLIVGSSIVVVLFFGAPAATQQRSLEGLLLALESSGGGRRIGLLLPREKEHWQAGLELTKRLETKDKEFTPAEVQMIRSRLSAMIRAELAQSEPRGSDQWPAPVAGGTGSRASGPVAPQGSTRFAFLVRALGLTEQPEAVETLIEVVRSAAEHYAALAMQQLGNLAHLPGSKAAVEPIIRALNEAKSSETRLIACTVLSVLADEDDREVIEALSAMRLSAVDQDVEWSAALALARLGSDRGKSTLLDLLDRSYWEQGSRYQMTDASNVARTYEMPANRVDEAIAAAVDAASNLEDADLWESIERLRSDRSFPVRQRATEAVRHRTGGGESAAKD